MDEQQRMQTYANAFVHCLPVAARTLNDIHAALQRIVCGYDAGARRRLVSFSAEQKKDRPSLEVERNGLISRHDFCTALNNFFVRRPELSFDPECVFDTFFTGERGALMGAEAFAPPGDEQLDKSPGACAVRFATGEIESDYPLRLLQCCPAHVTRRSVLPSHPAEIEELEAAAHVQDSGLCKNVLDATSEQPCRVMARPRRASLRDIAAGIYNLYSGDAAGEWRAKGRAGVSEAIQRSGRAAMASNDEASRRRQLLYLLRRRRRSGRDKSTWFDHLGSLGAVLSTWNCQANPARGRHDDGSRLAPMISSLGQKENENKVTFEQFLVSLKHYLGEIRRADAGPRAADEECRVPFLQRDARLLFDAFEPDKSDRVCVAAIVRVVNSEAPDVETQSTSSSAIKATVREQAAPANGIDIVSREQQRVFLERAIGGFSTGGEHPVLSRGNFIASIRALLGKRAEQFDEPSTAGWQQYLARMRSNNARWTATDAHRMAFHAQWQTQHAVAYGALFDEAYEAMKTQQPENDDEADSDKSANQTQYSFMRDTLGLDYGQRFTLNSRGSWAADSINQVPPKFYAKHLAGRMNAKAAKITNSGDTDDRTITLNAAVEFMRDPQQCAFEAWDSRRQKAGFQAWQEGDPTEGWISRDDLK
eukprot:g1713.t1